MQNLLKNKSLWWSLLGVVVLVVGIVVALQLIPQEQDTRREAAVPSGAAKMVVAPQTLSVAVGESKSAKVSFSTGGKSLATISVLMSYPYQGTTPPFTIESLTKSSQLPEGWSCSMMQASTANQAVTIKASCNFAGTTGFTTTNPQQQIDLFTFLVKGGAKTTGAVEFKFDAEETTIGERQPAADKPSDVLDIPANLAITVTAATTPPAEKKITLTASTLTCSVNDFTATATVTEGTTPKANTAVLFKYNNEQKTASTNAQGVATATFTKGASNMNVTAEVSGYTTGSAAVNLPTGCSTTGTDTDKRILLSYSGLSCTENNFTVTAEAKEDSTLWRDVLITFSYDGQQKTATTNSEGKASVSFPSSATNKSVEATAQDFDKGSIEVKRPTDCSTSTTTGISCNGGCSASRDCKSGLTCVGGYCRDARCSSDASCGCSDVDVAAQNGTTELPESGFDQTAAMAILGSLFLLGGAQLLWSFRQRAESSSQE